MIQVKKILWGIGLLFVVLLISFFSFRAEQEAQSTQANIEQPKLFLNTEEKRFLLNVARQTLNHYLKGDPIPKISVESLSPALKEARGCFVTLEQGGNLRGCIGHIQPIKSLCDCVVENAINAASKDPRFPEVDLNELNSISIEISALTVPKKLDIEKRETLFQLLVPGRDGVILRQGWYQATFLPQVWRHFSDEESFLNALCEKGGMPRGCWKDDETEVFTYQAEVFKETKP